MLGTGKMHPSDDELAAYARAQTRESESFMTVRDHLDGCEGCRMKLTEIEQWHSEIDASMAEGLPPDAHSLADRVFADSIVASRVILLTPMTMPQSHEPAHLAADGQTDGGPVSSLEHRATLVSENPELVLRIMYDRKSGEETIHLIGADPAVTRHVLIHVDDPPLDLVTDDEGKATLTDRLMDDPTGARWEIRLPDATFALTPLEDAGTLPGSEEEVTLDAGPDNQVGVTVSQSAEGLALRVRLLRVNGRDNIERARLVISQRTFGDRVVESGVNEPCVVSGLSASQPIDIRIFAL